MTTFEDGYMAAIRLTLGVAEDVPFAPEALAMIHADCARFVTHALDVCAVEYERSGSDGEWFWYARQRLGWMDNGYPTLTITLNEDGKVHLS